MVGIDQCLAGLGKVSPQLSACEVGSQAGRCWNAQVGGQLRRFPERGSKEHLNNCVCPVGLSVSPGGFQCSHQLLTVFQTVAQVLLDSASI